MGDSARAVWAALGGFCILFAIIMWGKWFITAKFTPTNWKIPQAKREKILQESKIFLVLAGGGVLAAIVTISYAIFG